MNCLAGEECDLSAHLQVGRTLLFYFRPKSHTTRYSKPSISTMKKAAFQNHVLYKMVFKGKINDRPFSKLQPVNFPRKNYTILTWHWNLNAEARVEDFTRIWAMTPGGSEGLQTPYHHGHVNWVRGIFQGWELSSGHLLMWIVSAAAAQTKLSPRFNVCAAHVNSPLSPKLSSLSRPEVYTKAIHFPVLQPCLRA